MAKIQITESELKSLIAESVKAVISENMGESRQARFNRRYKNYQNAVNKYNNDFSKDWSEMDDNEKAKWISAAKEKSASLSAQTINPEGMYNSYRNSARTAMDTAGRKRGVGAIMQANLQTVQKKLAEKETELTNARQAHQNDLDKIQKALGMIQENATKNINEEVGADSPVQAILAKIGELSKSLQQFNQASLSKGNPAIGIKNINTWKNASVQLANLRKQQQQAAPVTNTPNTQIVNNQPAAQQQNKPITV